MAKQLFNLTLPVVIQEIDDILANYPKQPYQQIFSEAGLRQDLVAYVLSRVTSKYIVIETSEPVVEQISSHPCPRIQLLDIGRYIHLGIYDLMEIHNRNKCKLIESDNFNCTPLMQLVDG